MMSRKLLVDSTVIVVGGTSGIGLATAEAAAAEGARVVVTGRDEGRARSAGTRLGDPAAARRLDAHDQAGMAALCAELGSVDHLVLAAGSGSGAGPFATLDLDALRAGFEQKVVAHVAAAQAALPALARTGSITFVGAVSANRGIPGTAGLAASNAAVQALVAPLALELAPVRVNAVSPGVIDTPWWSAYPAEQRAAMFAQFAERAPAGRVGRPEDVAGLIVSLMANDYVSGAVVACDGGLRHA
jgi:NAD(P)-dependent dehydrogenase (short-subunit alcohol dehydrogenase family)